MAFITPNGYYRVGNFVPEGSIQVPARPSIYHKWENNSWVLDVVRKEADEALAAIRSSEFPLEDDFKKIIRQLAIAILLKEAMALAPQLTKEQVHAYLMSQGKAYAKMVELEEQIQPLRDMIP